MNATNTTTKAQRIITTEEQYAAIKSASDPFTVAFISRIGKVGWKKIFKANKLSIKDLVERLERKYGALVDGIGKEAADKLIQDVKNVEPIFPNSWFRRT
jgi:hypothetical protein